MDIIALQAKMREAFQGEAAELLEELDSSLLELEARPGDTDLLSRVFRAIHTIKGSGATAGFKEMASFTHHVEELFDEARQGRLAITPEIVDLALKAKDIINDLILAQEPARWEKECALIVQRIIHYLPRPAAASPAEANRTSADQEHRYQIYFRPNEQIFFSGTDPVNLVDELRTLGEARVEACLEAIPSIHALEPEKCYLAWRIQLDSKSPLDRLQEIFSFVADDSEVRIEKEERPSSWAEDDPRSVFLNITGQCLEALEMFSPQVLENSGPEPPLFKNVLRTLKAMQAAFERQKQAEVRERIAEVAALFEQSIQQSSALSEACKRQFRECQIQVQALYQALRRNGGMMEQGNDSSDVREDRSPTAPVKYKTGFEPVQGRPAGPDRDPGPGGSNDAQPRSEDSGRRSDAALIRDLEPGAAIHSNPGREVPVGAASMKSPGREEGKRAASIRVDQEKLDRLMSAVSELLVARNAFPMLAKKLVVEHGLTGAGKELRDAADHVSHIADDLQAAVMSIRMLPIRTVFQKFPRMVRDICRSLGKEAQLKTEGEDVELDKKVIEQMGDPLVHLVRNALDHGIETPEARLQKGKPRQGQLKLRAFKNGCNVLIEIRDDGRGMDPEVLKRKAVEKGIMTSEQAAALDRRRALELILLPGFSTARKITDISGRGVGMDVVRNNIHQLQGTLHIDSREGGGSTFTISLPASLMVSKGILVEAAREEYILPIEAVMEVVKLPSNGIHHHDQISFVQVRKEIYSLIRLSEHFASKPLNSPWPDEICLAVVRAGQSKIGVVIDRCVCEVEVIVKPLPSEAGQVNAFQGATIMGDGRVVLVINPNTLL